MAVKTSEKGPTAMSLSRSVDNDKAPLHVLLTGSTGTLGAYLLDCLLSTSNISRITCLNRSTDAATRQIRNHETRGLSTTFPEGRVFFLQADLASPDGKLGLEDYQYQSLLETTTHIVHNAWAVDFNKHFSTFKPQIMGVNNLIQFCHASPLNPRLFFMSSVSVAGRWGAMPGALAEVPEIVLEDWRLAKLGYGQSKLVAERLIAEAATNWAIDGAICRVAQVGGPVLNGTQGEWNRTEWVPSMLQSSLQMHIIPETLGPMDTVDWLPVDLVAKICIELLFDGQVPLVDGNEKTMAVTTTATAHSSPSNPNKHKTKPKTKKSASSIRVWHVVNPHSVSYSTLLSSFLSAMQTNPLPTPVPFITWVEELERRTYAAAAAAAADEADTSSALLLPATKLLSFFDDLRDKAVRFPRTPSATLSTRNTVKHSRIMAEVPPVNSRWAELWIKQWEF